MYIDTARPFCFNTGMEMILAEIYRLVFLGVEDGLSVEESWQLAVDSIGPEARAFII